MTITIKDAVVEEYNTKTNQYEKRTAEIRLEIDDYAGTGELKLTHVDGVRY